MWGNALGGAAGGVLAGLAMAGANAPEGDTGFARQFYDMMGGANSGPILQNLGRSTPGPIGAGLSAAGGAFSARGERDRQAAIKAEEDAAAKAEAEKKAQTNAMIKEMLSGSGLSNASGLTGILDAGGDASDINNLMLMMGRAQRYEEAMGKKPARRAGGARVGGRGRSGGKKTVSDVATPEAPAEQQASTQPGLIRRGIDQLLDMMSATDARKAEAPAPAPIRGGPMATVTPGQVQQGASPAPAQASPDQERIQWESKNLDLARMAIQDGKDPVAVANLLRKNGIDPAKL